MGPLERAYKTSFRSDNMNINNIAVIEANNEYYIGVNDSNGKFAGFISYTPPPNDLIKIQMMRDEKHRIWIRKWEPKHNNYNRRKMRDLDKDIDLLRSCLFSKATRHFILLLKKNYRKLNRIKKIKKNYKSKKKKVEEVL